METKRLYEKLSLLENIAGEIAYNENTLIWRFHDSLCIEALSEDGDTYIRIGNGDLHYHPDEEDMFQELCDINDGKKIFVSKLGIFGRHFTGIYEKDFFEAHKRLIKLGFGTRCYTSRGMIK